MEQAGRARWIRQLAEANSVVILGLGRFGSAMALELMRLGVEVLGVDKDREIVQQHSALLTQAVVADSTSEEALRQIGVPDFDRVVIGIGIDIEASLLTASLLREFGVEHVWAKAITDAHGRILEQLGVGHVVYPEVEMGQRVARLVRGRMRDFVEFEDDFAVVRCPPPAASVGRTLAEVGLRAEFGVTVVAVHRADGSWSYATAETVLAPDDEVLVTGRASATERFAALD